jgi:hypothetical protein
MAEIIKLELSQEEAQAHVAEMDRMLTTLRFINEYIEQRQQETALLQAETREIIARMKERQHVATVL